MNDPDGTGEAPPETDQPGTDQPGTGDVQGALLHLPAPAAARRSARRRARPPSPLAETDPVARVVVDVPLPHLDRPFEYTVPATMSLAARPGVRVRVRFAGQDVDGYVLARTATAEHHGPLASLRRVVSDEPILDDHLLALCRTVADRWAGTLADVLRLAVPRRHAEAEQRPAGLVLAAGSAAPPPPRPAPGPWAGYPAGPAFLDHLARGAGVRAAWTPLPGEDWAAALAVAAATTASAGRGALLLAPDHRDLARLDAALRVALGPGRHVTLSADAGPAARYEAWLALRRGTVRVAVGTRAAAFAPVADLGLLAVWDDGDDSYAEPRAPYPHARDVLALRSAQQGAALLLAATARTAQVQLWCERGWVREVAAERASVRAAAPRVLLPGGDGEAERDPAARLARLPNLAWRTARAALAHGPVLVQVPRRGYLFALSCATCRAPARCPHCAGPLHRADATAPPTCGRCARPAPAWRCQACEGSALRSAVVGADRTAEELGRAFPGVKILTSGGDRVLAQVPPGPALVVATPGAEPFAPGGYAAALLLDGWMLLERPELRAGEEALRRWMAAATLVRRGAPVVLLAEPGPAPVEALVRWDPAWHAARDFAERAALGLPPAVTVAVLTGPQAAVDSLVELASLPPGAELMGGVPQASSLQSSSLSASPLTADDPPPPVTTLVRAPSAQRAALARALGQAAAVRSARKLDGAVRVQIDPLLLGV